MLEIYLNGNADVARDIFNAIATFVGTSSYMAAIHIAAVFSVIGGTFMYMKSRDLLSLAKWVGAYFLVTVLLIGPTSSITITDTTDELATYQVDNVPSSLALIASTLTTITYGLQRGIEDVFHMPNDQEYTKTGMLFGSQVFAKAAGYQIQNPDTKRDFNAFFDRCILGDVEIAHKYTFNELKSSTDIWSFLDSQKMSPIRGVNTASGFKTCQAFYPMVKKEMLADPSNTNLTLFGVHLFGTSGAHITDQKIGQSIQSAYSYFGGISKSAGQILAQNATINAIRDAQINSMARGNAISGMENLAYTQTNLQKTLAGLTGFKTAAYWMPKMQVYLLLLVIGVFPLIALLALQPAWLARVLPGYISSMLLVCSFPLVWDILHFLMMSALYNATHDSLGNAIPLTFSNANALVQAHVSFASLGGYLMLLSIPLTAALVKGLSSSMIYMGQYLGGALQSMTGANASAAASGNVSLENFSMGQSHYNNTQANKFDTNSLIQSGLHSVMGANGSMITQAPDGKLIVNNAQGLSNLGFRVNMHERAEATLASEMSHLQQDQQSLTTQRSHNWSQMASTLTNFAQTEGKNATLSDGFQVTNHTSARDSMSYASSLYNNWQLSHDHADKNDHSASRGMSAEAFARLAVAGSLGIANFTGGVGASANVSASRTNSHSDQQAFYNSLSADQRRNYDQAMDNIQNYGRSHNLDLSNTQNDSLLNQFAAEARQDQSLSQQESVNQSKMDSVSTRQSYVESNSQSVDLEATQSFVHWMQQNHGDKAGVLLSRAADTSSSLNEMRQSYIDQFLREKSAGLIEKIDSQEQGQVLSNHYNNDAAHIASAGKSSMEQASQSNMQDLQQQGHGAGVGVSPQKAGAVAGEVLSHQFENTRTLVKAEDDALAQRNALHDQAGKFEKAHERKMGQTQMRNIGQQLYKEGSFMTDEPTLGGQHLKMPNEEGKK
jgi:conjugal transfer mating pair stabilization protein TraG